MDFERGLDLKSMGRIKFRKWANHEKKIGNPNAIYHR